MCSLAIILANSCYIDNFLLVVELFTKAITMGVVLGTVVGVLLLFIKNLK